MCKRYICTQKISTIESRFNLEPGVLDALYPLYNISKGDSAPVITNKHPKHLQLFHFGMTPSFAKTKMDIINARVEGERNKDNDSRYSGAKAIIQMPVFRKQIRSQRCLVIADAFIIGAEENAKPYLVYLKNKVRPFAFAGLWDVWKDEEGNELFSFTIITSTANELLRKLGQQRSPVILPRKRELAWLNNSLPLADAIRYLQPYPTHLMDAYPISDAIKNPAAEGRQLIEPVKHVVQKKEEPQTTIDVSYYEGWRFRVN